jgi:hypothetical protein
MSGRRPWLVVVLVGLLVALTVMVLLGLKWEAETGDYWCGTTFDRAEVFDAIKERCDRAIYGLWMVEVILALLCGFVAAGVTAGALGRHEMAEERGRDWYG